MGLRRTVRLLFLSCAAVLLAVPLCLHGAQEPQSTPSTAGQELSLKEFQAEIDRCSEAFKQPAVAEQLRNSLPPAWKVRTGAQSVEVSTAPIVAKIRELAQHPERSEKITQDAELRLKALRDAAQAMSSAEDTAAKQDVDAAKEKLQKILDRKEFQKAAGPSQSELYQERLNQWLARHLLGLFRFLHISQQTGNALAWTVMGLAFLALCYIVWKWLAANTGTAGSAIEEVKPKLPSDTREWVREAFAAAERGNYREAIHCAYWAAVAKLEDLNVLSRDRARTPRESLRLLEQHPNEQGMLREMTGRFELIWYGYRPASAEDWSGARKQLEKMGCRVG